MSSNQVWIIIWILYLLRVHIFWEGHKILRNLHQLFDLQYIGQIIGGDITKFYGLLEYMNFTVIFFLQPNCLENATSDWLWSHCVYFIAQSCLIRAYDKPRWSRWMSWWFRSYTLKRMQSRRKVWGKEDQSQPFFSIYSSQKEQYYAHQISLSPPDFLTFRRLWMWCNSHVVRTWHSAECVMRTVQSIFSLRQRLQQAASSLFFFNFCYCYDFITSDWELRSTSLKLMLQKCVPKISKL